MVMSNDQVSDLTSRDTNVSRQQSAVMDPEDTMVFAYDDDDDDDDDDDSEEADKMQFATETIVKYFSRCISTAGKQRACSYNVQCFYCLCMRAVSFYVFIVCH